MPETLVLPNDFQKPLVGVFAVVGCDGTGKSTLTADLLLHLSKVGPVERRYLGTISGEMGDKIKLVPIIGDQLLSYLAKKAARAQDMKKKLPGTGTAILMHILSHWRARQLKKVICLSQKGIKIISDRYPQAEIVGFRYDGPGMSFNRNDNWLLRKIAVREQALYQWMSEQKPSLVIRLNIDAETAFERKPDHDIAELRDKILIMPRLNFNGAKIIDIDARAPYPQVLEAALKAINESC